MTDPNQVPPTVNDPGPVPAQPEATPAIKKSMPVVIGLGAVILVIGLANVGSLFHSGPKEAPRSALPLRPASPNAQQVTSFEAQQKLLAQRDEAERSGNNNSRHKWTSFGRSKPSLVQNRPMPRL